MGHDWPGGLTGSYSVSDWTTDFTESVAEVNSHWWLDYISIWGQSISPKAV